MVDSLSLFAKLKVKWLKPPPKRRGYMELACLYNQLVYSDVAV